MIFGLIFFFFFLENLHDTIINYMNKSNREHKLISVLHIMTIVSTLDKYYPLFRWKDKE